MEWLVLGAIVLWLLGSQKSGPLFSGTTVPVGQKAVVPDPTVLPYREVGYEPAVAAAQEPAHEGDPTEDGGGDVTSEDIADIINEEPDPYA